MKCALCLQGAPTDDMTAVTVMNGYAVCEEHSDVFSSEAAMLAEVLKRRQREYEQRRW